MSFQRSRRLVRLFVVAFIAAPLLSHADVPKYDDPNDDRNFAAAGTRSEEEIQKCKAAAAEFTKPTATCKEQAEMSLKPESCDDSAALGAVNATKALNGGAFGLAGTYGIGLPGMTGSQDSCKAVSKGNSTNYDTLGAVRATCATAKKTCEDVCGQVKAGMQKVPALCMNEMAPLKKQVYGYVTKCADLKKKIDKLSDQMQIVKNEERPMWEPGGCMVATAAGTEVEQPNDGLHNAIKFDDRFGDKGPTTGQIMLKDSSYRQMLGISDAQAERIINAKGDVPSMELIHDYGLTPTFAREAAPSYDWSAAAQPVLSDQTLKQLGQQYGPAAPAAAPTSAIGPADNSPSINAAAPAPMNMQAAPMPQPTQSQAAAASAPVAPVNNPNSPAYDITALPQTPKYDQVKPEQVATTGQHQAGALYGGKVAEATAAVATTVTDDPQAQPAESRTVGGVAPMQPLKSGDSSGLSASQSREFVNGDSAGGGGNSRGPAAVRGNAASVSDSSSSGGGRLRSFISSIFSSDDKPSRPAGSDFRYKNDEFQKEQTRQQVDLRQFLPGEVQARKSPTIAGMNPLRQKGIHGSETILWNAMNDRYKALAPTLITEP